MILMKKSSIFIAVLLIVISALPIYPKQALGVSAQSAILMDQKTGRILFSKDENTKRRIASITKIMTAVLAVESGKLENTVTVSSSAAGTEGSSLYLKAGEKAKLKDLVYGLMLRSGNDAAMAIAEYIGGSKEGFAYLMNQKAAQIGMTNTNFTNPHGLDDSGSHYSTAYDMALLMRYAMQDPAFKEISGTKVHRAPNPDEKWDRVWKNKNKLLTSLYEYCTGGKTGYTKLAKRTLVTTASKEGRDFIAVTINAPDDWNDHISMYETAFSKYDLYKIKSKGMLNEAGDVFYKDRVFITRDVVYPLSDEEKNNLRVQINLQKPDQSWEKPSNVPSVVGSYEVTLDEKLIQKVPIYYDNGKTEKPAVSFWQSFKQLFFALTGASYG
ncbi:D-alanyl-D-alanine carboxypeptidase [Metabacillus sp. GX 13764]|uniref:D-alanyl-D-alanine carboxypeptidase family protein n=1 Tax=Metabacillus kandeliae TaxID=2900151 RepID=UPI001E46F3B4|nr:D-alanyl-D-alanine carboxypeptidase family protein [Metabacillus kandeliae]MCD7033314.1 D-alanyl-D-alanine carboxypeptidase [Metabacillus kandeliae]